jgi:phospholipid-binding lipoprotein MlaA
MQNSSRLALFLLIFLLFFGCSQRVVKQDKNNFNNTAQIESQDETAGYASQTAPPNHVTAFDGDEDAFEDNGEEFDEDEKEFDEFEDEFGDDEIGEVFDPFGGYNRAMTGFNDKLYFWVLKPVAKGYRAIVPEFARRGINNFFKNLYYPVRVVNNVLQLKFKNAGEETLRFATNTTIGVLGLWDPAEVWFGLEAHPEDFGQTLGVWGVGPGPHIVLPVLGPSNLRDGLALAPSWIYLDPINNFSTMYEWASADSIEELERIEVKAGIWTFEKVNYNSLHIGEYEDFKKDAVDLYIFMRDVYEQNRQKAIEE